MFLGALLTVAAGSFVAAAPPTRPPNVVVILADDLGFSDLGCYGGEIDTPHLDALAAGGLRFTQGYDTARCWPSRAALLTGYYPQAIRRDALPGGEGGSQGRRPAWARLLPELLAPAGYRSYHCGKWHVDGAPLEQGFAKSLVVTGPGESNFFDPAGVVADGRPVAAVADFYATSAIGDHALACLADHGRDHAAAPFFLYLPFTAPHFPLHAPQDLVAKYRDRYRIGWDAVREARARRLAASGIVTTPAAAAERDVGPPYRFPDAWRRLGPGEVSRPLPWIELTDEQREFQAAKMAIHAAMVEAMDREVGRVVGQLRRMNAFDDTLVLFASDNGASAEIMIRGEGHDPAAPPGSRKTFLCLGPGWSTAANTPFRRHKTWTHEGGIATPWIVHWPRGIGGRGELRHQPVHLVDVAPTVLEVAGVEPPREHEGAAVPPMQGRSFAAALAAAAAPPPHEALWWCHEGHRAVRVGDWKLVAAKGTPWELYDLARDRCETSDLAAGEPGRVADLAAVWQRIADECQALAAPAGRKPAAPKPAARRPGGRPNIIYVMTDDQGYGDIAAHGNRVLRTPHLDRMRRESVRFGEFHASPTCSPTRAALLTGRHEFRSGVTHTIQERERLALTATTLPQLLGTAGYACGIFGKWHLGDEEAYQPGRRGFDRVFIHGAGGIGQSYPGSCGDVPGNSSIDPVIRSDGSFVNTKGYCTDVFFSAALEWIDRCRREGTPFFCYLTPNAPHGPLVCPPGAEAALRERLVAAGGDGAHRRDVARFYAMIENIDENMGRLFAALREWGIADETLVVFTTDNGSATGAPVCNDGMRGAKGSPYRGGTRVPSFWRWPGTLPEGVDVPAVTAHIDVLPTLCELAGVSVPAQVEGRSLVPLLCDASAPWPDRVLVTHVGRWNRGRAAASAYANCRIREGRWQLVNTENRRDAWELYDVAADPGETRDVAAAHPDVVARLAAAYDDWWGGIQGDLVNEEATGPAENPFRVAYRSQREAAFGARQAAASGGGGLPEPAARRRPSVLVILADDQRADTIGALGNPRVRTPALDGLVARGTSFDRCYCMGSLQGAVCVPSRAMLLSGRSLFRVDEQLAAGDTWPESFSRAGARTFLVGKWHNGADSATRLFAAGAAVFLGGMSDQWRVPVSSFVAPGRPSAPVAADRHSSELFGDAAVDFVRALGDEPFFAWVAFTAPHDPRQAPPEHRRRFAGAEPPPPENFLPRHPFDNGELRVRDEKLLGWPRTAAEVSGELADYYACIEALDAQVGRLLAALEVRGRLADTIVVFTSDHGLALGSHGLLGKQNLYEHSMRVPAVVAGPGVPAGRRVDALCYLFDLMATVGELAGVPAPAASEGRSLGPVLRGEAQAVRDELLLAYRDVQRALVTPRWKLIEYPRVGRRQLFDLEADPEERHDRWADADQAETRGMMENALAEAERVGADPRAAGR